MQSCAWRRTATIGVSRCRLSDRATRGGGRVEAMVRTVAAGRSRLGEIETPGRERHTGTVLLLRVRAAGRTRRLAASCLSRPEDGRRRSGPRCRSSAGSRGRVKSLGRLAGGHTLVACGERLPFPSLAFASLTGWAVVRPRTRGTARSQRTPSARRYRRCCSRPAPGSGRPESCTSPTRGPRGGRRCRPRER